GPKTPRPRTATCSRPGRDMACTGTGLFGGHFLPLHGFVSMILDFGFVLNNLAIDFVGQKVDGSVEVFVTRFAVDVLAWQADGDVGDVLYLFDREHDLCVNDVVEVATDARHFVGGVFSDGGGDFQMTTTNAQVHIYAPTVRVEACSRQYYVVMSSLLS